MAVKFFVTLCAADQDVGANPFWHTALLLSQFNEAEKRMEVCSAWGFYALPVTAPSSSWFIYVLQHYAGLHYDISGNHGMFVREEYRFLDRGCGLHGVTFELKAEHYLQLEARCMSLVEGQQDAIHEAVEALGLQVDAKRKTHFYEQEAHSRKIFEWETHKAQAQGRESRLKAFELTVCMGVTGPYMASCSNNCKSQALLLLQGILSEQQIARLTEAGKHPNIPRWSGLMEDIYLHSDGPWSFHTKTSGARVLFRSNKDIRVKLYWTLPPQVFELLTPETEAQFRVDPDYVDDLKTLTKKLQRLEWFLLQAPISERYALFKIGLTTKVVALYRGLFAKAIEYKPETSRSWQGYALSLFALPRTRDQRGLQAHMDDIKNFLNSLYMAVVDHWELD